MTNTRARFGQQPGTRSVCLKAILPPRYLSHLQLDLIFRLDMKTYHPMPDALAETAAFLTPHEQDQLWRAAILMANSRGMVMRLTAMFGRRIETLGADLKHRRTLRRPGLGGSDPACPGCGRGHALEQLQSGDVWPVGRPSDAPPQRPRGNRAHRLAATASGVASGFVGLPGVLFDIPFTTTTILRSIAEVDGTPERISRPRTPSAPASKSWPSAVRVRSMMKLKSATGRRVSG